MWNVSTDGTLSDESFYCLLARQCKNSEGSASLWKTKAPLTVLAFYCMEILGKILSMEKKV